MKPTKTKESSDLNPITELLTEPPVETPIPSYYDPELEPKFRTIENSSELLEDRLVKTLLNLMEDSSTKSSVRRAAASDVADLLGKKKNSTQGATLISAQNLQLNQLNANPELKKHLIDSVSGLEAVLNGTNSGVKSSEEL